MKNGGECHILVDEFHDDNIDKEYCDKLKRCLEENFQTSTVVIATQSVKTTKQVIEKDKVTVYANCNLKEAGMKDLSLKTAMRNPSEIFKLTKYAIGKIEESDTLLPLQTRKKRVTIPNQDRYTDNDDEDDDDDDDGGGGGGDDLSLIHI